VQAVAGLSTRTDFLRLGGWHDAPDSPEARLIGGPISARPEAAQQASPVTHVRAGMPPFLLVYGDHDEIVPPAQSRLLADALRAAGAEVRLVPMPGSGHDFDASDPHLPVATRLVREFFLEHLCG
jgi:dipeptidyl aminopeptidase/acylaminoacyl peptidase